MLVFLGIMGEYVGAIYTQLQHRPYAVELDRINFDKGFDYPKTGPVQLPMQTYTTPAQSSVPSPS